MSRRAHFSGRLISDELPECQRRSRGFAEIRGNHHGCDGSAAAVRNPEFSGLPQFTTDQHLADFGCPASTSYSLTPRIAAKRVTGFHRLADVRQGDNQRRLHQPEGSRRACRHFQRGKGRPLPRPPWTSPNQAPGAWSLRCSRTSNGYRTLLLGIAADFSGQDLILELVGLSIELHNLQLFEWEEI